MMGLAVPPYGQFIWWYSSNALLIWMILWRIFGLTMGISRDEGKGLYKKIAFNGFLIGFVFHLIWFWWFTGLHPMDWLGITGLQSIAVAYGGWLLLSVIGGALFAVLFLIFRWMNDKCHWLFVLFVFPLIWVGLFQLWGQFDWFIPWANIEYSFFDFNLGEFNWVTHPYWLVFVSLAFAYSFNNSYKLKNKFLRFVDLTIWLGLTFWVLSVGSSIPQSHHLPFDVQLIQGDLSIDVIRDPQKLKTAKEAAYFRPLDQMDPAETDLLVVLPEEGIISGWVNQQAPLNNPDVQRLQTVANVKNAYIAVGASTFQRQKNNDEPLLHNSFLLIGPDEKTQFYHKRDLVPFGEREPNFLGLLPKNWLNNLMKTLNVDYEFAFSAGTENKLLTMGQYKLLPTVCFELVSQPWTVASGEKPDAVINVSNLGWFHDHPSLQAQFEAIARYKARYYNLPVVISANTGPSVFIGNNGFGTPALEDIAYPKVKDLQTGSYSLRIAGTTNDPSQ